MPEAEPGFERDDVVAAVDWGGTWIRVALAGVDGRLLRTARQLRPDGIAAQCALVGETVAGLAEALGRPPAALGVGIAGITRAGWVQSAVNIGILDPFPLARVLQQETQLTATIVNDTQAAAAAEAAALGPGTSVLLTVGTGVGGAVVDDGRLVVGNGAGGDFGHLIVVINGPACGCGGRGCLEAVVSGRALDRAATQLASTGSSAWLASRAADQGELHAGDLDAAARAGDLPARQVLEEAASALLAGLRSVTAAVDPRTIVLGGSLLAEGRVLTALVHQAWQDGRPRWSAARLRPAALGEEAGLRGAAVLAADALRA